MDYTAEVASLPPGNGLTIADNRAFFNTLRLNGGLSLIDGAPPIEYRFETVSTSADGATLTGSWLPITSVAPTNIGTFERLVPGFPWPTIQEVQVVVNGGSTPTVAGLDPSGLNFNIVPDANGWIQVPPLVPAPPMVPAGGTPTWRFI